MKFQVGDKVLVRHSSEEGEVIDIINDQMVMVEIRGVKFPAYTDQLDFPYFQRFSQKKLVTEKKTKTYIDQVPKEKVVTSSTLPQGVWLMLLPKFGTDEFGDEVVDYLKVHLINGTGNGFNIHYKLYYQGSLDMELKNQVFAHKDFYLHDIPFEKINDSPVLDCEFSLTTPEKSKADFYETSLKLKPKQVFSRIEEIKAKGEPTFSYQLFETYPQKQPDADKLDLGKLSASGYKVYEASKARQHLAPARSVVDIHIERLTDNWERMNNYDIVSMQLAEFEKYYELALAHRQPTLIVIHGVGTGKLRDEIHDLLRHRKEVKSFVNQYHPSYGYGATEIYFQY